MFISFTACAFCKLLSVNVFSYFPFSFEGRMWNLIASVPDHCLSFFTLHKFNVEFSLVHICSGEVTPNYDEFGNSSYLLFL